MHTYKGKSLVIHHDGDYKGECYIVDKETKTQIKVISLGRRAGDLNV